MNKQESVTVKFRELRERAKLSMDDLAKAMGYKGASSIQRYEDPNEYRKQFLNPDLASKLAKVLVGRGDPPIEAKEIWALTRPTGSFVSSFDPDEPEVEPQDEFPNFSREHWKPETEGAIPELDAKLGAGHGIVGDVISLPVGNGSISGHKVVGEWLFPTEFLRNEAKASPTQSFIMEIVGDSMQPTYTPGDRVIVDLSQNTMTSDTVYAISDGHTEPQIKRLQRVPFSDPPQVIIISDNPNLQSFTVDLERLTIIGRICGHVARK